jgi:TPP-dependent 2-oxoacid decarboxylase
MGSVTVGSYLIGRLAELGVRHVFGIPGDYVLSFYAALERSQLAIVNCADEQGAGFAADAYARVNGIGAVCVTYGVGGLKVVNSTAQALAEKSPVIVISGGPGIAERRRDPLLHHKIRSFESQLDIFREVTCSAAIISDPESAQRDIDAALAACLRRSQPVYLELPRDLVSAPLEVKPRTEERLEPDEAALEEAIAEATLLVRAAERPVIIAGEELARFRIVDQMPALLERSGIPVATTTLSKSVVDETHPLFVGVYEGAIGHETTRRYVEESDCLIILGANLSDATLGINTARLDPAVTIASSSSQTWVHRHTYPDVTLVDFVAGLARSLPSRARPVIAKPPRPGAWQPDRGAQVSVGRLFECLNAFITPETTVVADVGDALFAGMDLVVEAWDFIAPAYYLSLGFAVPGAVGVQLANPETRPLVLVGDGAFQMTGMELTTAVRYGLDPIVILLDNSGYGTERPMLDGRFNDLVPWRYAHVPEVLGGGRGYEIHTEGELDDALRSARDDRSGFSLLHVHLEKHDLSPALQRLTALVAERVRQDG